MSQHIVEDNMGRTREMPVYIADLEIISASAKRFTIRSADCCRLPAFEAGSNIEVGVPLRSGDKPTPYSITSSPDESDHYQIIVVDSPSDNDSKNNWLNRNARIGDRLKISMPRRGIDFSNDNNSAYFIAGGSGIAAFLSHLNTVCLTDKNYEIAHIVRQRDDIFEYLNREALDYLTINTLITTEVHSFDIRNIFADKDNSVTVYISGSSRFISDVIDSAIESGWDTGNLFWDKYAHPMEDDRPAESAVI